MVEGYWMVERFLRWRRPILRHAGSALFFLFVFGGELLAQPPSLEGIPELLRPWVPWVVRDIEERIRCPVVQGKEHERFCAWAGPLSLEVDRQGARFEQAWRVDVASWAALPGSKAVRPLDVRIDGRPAVVVLRDGVPRVWLEAGPHRVQGRLGWSHRPSSLPVPATTGIVRLTLDGQSMPLPRRERDGVLWLSEDRQGATAAERQDALRIVVHRRIEDDVPLLVETRIQLEVSGRAREQRLAPVLLPGTEALRIETPLPARLDAGALRVQLRPGRWELRILARRSERTEVLQLPAAQSEGWPRREVWVFSPHPEHRDVEVQGGAAVDPEQTLLPESWRGLRAFVVERGTSVRLVERRRGDEGRREAEAISVVRDLWLDFDGRGATVRDVLQGVLGTSQRLQVHPFLKLQRVEVDGLPQLVTRLPQGAVGVELRKRKLDLRAEGRLELSDVGHLPVSGWSFDPRSARMTLHLPPGWRAWALFGADRVRPQAQVWLDSWDLFEMFVLLLLTVAAWRLWGPVAAGLTFVVVLLTHPEGLHAGWWVPWFVLEAVRRGVPEGGFRRFFGWVEAAWVVVVLLVSLAFGVAQVRAALHPALEDVTVGGGIEAPAPVVETASPPEPEPKASGMAEPSRRLEDTQSVSWGSGGLTNMAYEVDPEAAVQTGPGLPHWHWRRVELTWKGPIASTHRVRLLLSPPWLSSLIGFVRVFLLGLLLWWLVRRGARAVPGPSGGGVSAAAVVMACGIALVAACSSPAEAQAPSTPVPGASDAERSVLPHVSPPSLLEELKERLAEPPACSPTCAELQRLDMELLPERFTVALRLGAMTVTAVPLPLALDQWMPNQVLLDDQESDGVWRDEHGTLWLRLPAGVHDVRLSGPAPEAEQVQFPLPMPPAALAYRSQGWELSGPSDDAHLGGALTFLRRRPMLGQEEGAGRGPSQVAVPPFVRVYRRLILGLQWRVLTRVERLSPPGTSVLLRIPALPGERPASESVRLEKGAMLVQLAADANALIWTSALTPRDELTLQAARSPRFVEVWEVEESPVWHVRYEGPAALYQRADEGVRRWKPWPGERLRIRVQRPEAAEGPTTTVEEARLEVRPGRRATDVSLRLQVRTSRGGDFRLHIAPRARVTSLRVGDEEVPVRFERGRVTVPLGPGLSSVRLDWREPRPLTFAFHAPRVRLPVTAANVTTTMSPDGSRWVLWTRGPRLGPGVLFWGLLVVLLVLAVWLGRWPRTGIGTFGWLLLLVGLSQVSVWAAALSVGWLLYVRPGRRTTVPETWPTWRRLLGAWLVVPWTLLALGVLLYAVHRGLLGTPKMQIEGNGSSATQLVWYADRVVSTAKAGRSLSDAAFYSVPVLVYRGAMLLWALWLAFALLGWLRAAWDRFSETGSWGWFRALSLAPASSRPAVSRATSGAGPAASVAAARPGKGPQGASSDPADLAEAPMATKGEDVSAPAVSAAAQRGRGEETEGFEADDDAEVGEDEEKGD